MITIDDELPAQPVVRRKLICVCGHAQGRHIVLPGRGQMCDALKGNCPCREMQLVLSVTDARVFMCSAEADVHPLVAGIIKLRAKGGEWEWVGTAGQCHYIPPGMGMCNRPMKTAVYADDGKRTVLRCERHGS